MQILTFITNKVSQWLDSDFISHQPDLYPHRLFQNGTLLAILTFETVLIFFKMACIVVNPFCSEWHNLV